MSQRAKRSKKRPFHRPALISILSLPSLLLAQPQTLFASAAELYDPVWATDLSWTDNNLFHSPLGSVAGLENNFTPWWQTQAAHPIADYSASLLPAGTVRLDTALDVEYTMHRPLRG